MGATYIEYYGDRRKYIESHLMSTQPCTARRTSPKLLYVTSLAIHIIYIDTKLGMHYWPKLSLPIFLTLGLDTRTMSNLCTIPMGTR